MFRNYVLVCFMICSGIMNAHSQAPQKMNYQAVIRTNDNQLVINRTVRMRISLLADSMNATASFVETHQMTTNALGVVQLEIGGGTVVSGNFATIPWSRGKVFIKTETDPSGGTNYTLASTTQLMSVPYALYSGDVPVSKNGDTVTIGKSRLIIPGSTLISSSLSDGLIAYYPFNGNANDESGNGYHGTVNGAILTSDKSGIPNKAFSFNGNNTLIDLPLMSILNNKTKLTISFWVKSPMNFDNQPYRAVFSHWTYSSAPTGPIGINIALSSQFYSTPLAVLASMEGGKGIESERNSVKENTWQHITVVYNGEDLLETNR